MTSEQPIILPDNIDQLPTENVGAYIEALAKEHGVTFKRTALDDLAETFSRLSDKEVVLDATKNLLVALIRAKIVSRRQAMKLLSNYMHSRT